MGKYNSVFEQPSRTNRVCKPRFDCIVPDSSIDCFNQCEYLPRENNSLSNKFDWYESCRFGWVWLVVWLQPSLDC